MKLPSMIYRGKKVGGIFNPIIATLFVILPFLAIITAIAILTVYFQISILAAAGILVIIRLLMTIMDRHIFTQIVTPIFGR